MSDNARDGQFSQARINDRQVTELIGLARGLLADGVLDDGEIHFLHKWLVANGAASENPLIKNLTDQINDILADGVVDNEERRDLFATLSAFAANDFELGEFLKATTLPLCNPAPDVTFNGNRFTFTGTFVFGKRKDCEKAAAELGGTAGALTKKTKFLVIGEYATSSWIQSSFGRKIEKAVEMRENGIDIALISEAYWRKQLGAHDKKTVFVLRNPITAAP
ncbi:MAG: NAD-dependent DNA ligase [Robiginitomaculum sp.]|nr:MAG: NAD-dependent DNA ligase [Robiginitomaculum sp.]